MEAILEAKMIIFMYMVAWKQFAYTVFQMRSEGLLFNALQHH